MGWDTVWRGRWRVRGENWEGRNWFLTPGALPLIDEVMAFWPQNHAADGTVAGRGHDDRNPKSDHRPRPFNSEPGVVRALDVGEVVENDGWRFAEMLRKTQDPRIKYVLHEDMIFSSYPRMNREPWTWAPLRIGHPTHVHISFTTLADTDTSPWNLEGGTDVFTNHEIAQLKRLVASLDEVGSNGGFAKFAVLAIRRERDAEGYAAKGHTHEDSGDGLRRGDSVTLQ